jgi:ribosomal protein S27AE
MVSYFPGGYWMEIAIAVIIIFALLLWFLLARKRVNRISRPRVYNQKCPHCNSDEIYTAGYGDRKECGKCGKIF